MYSISPSLADHIPLKQGFEIGGSLSDLSDPSDLSDSSDLSPQTKASPNTGKRCLLLKIVDMVEGYFADKVDSCA